MPYKREAVICYFLGKWCRSEGGRRVSIGTLQKNRAAALWLWFDSLRYQLRLNIRRHRPHVTYMSHTCQQCTVNISQPTHLDKDLNELPIADLNVFIPFLLNRVEVIAVPDASRAADNAGMATMLLILAVHPPLARSAQYAVRRRLPAPAGEVSPGFVID